MNRATSVRHSLATKAPRRRPLISLTPLIDVVFILLVFFMLASSFMDRRTITLDTPTARGGSPTMEGAMVVDIRPDGLRLAGETVSLSALTGRIAARLSDHPEQRVLVRPMPGVALQTTVDVFDGLTRVGVANIALSEPVRR